MSTVESVLEEIRRLEASAAAGKKVSNGIADARERLAQAYIIESGRERHLSSCATSHAPAEMPGPCDCLEQLRQMPAEQRQRYEHVFPDLLNS